MAFWNRKKDVPEEPPTPKLETLWTTNMQLRVAAPKDEGWQRMEAAGAGGMLATFKCVFGSPPEALALDAFVYTLAEGMPGDVAALEARNWREHFLGKMFASIDSLSASRIDHRGRTGFVDPGLQISVEGEMRDPVQPLKVVERYVPLADKLLLVTIAGSAELHQTHAAVVGSWLEHASVAS